MGLFSNIFQHGAVLDVFCMHAAPKPPEPLASLVSMNKSPFPLAIYACIGNRQFDWRVPLDWGCRARCAGDQAVQCRFRVSRANRHPYWRFAFHRNRQCGWRFALFEIFPSPSIIKEKAPESARYCWLILLLPQILKYMSNYLYFFS